MPCGPGCKCMNCKNIYQHDQGESVVEETTDEGNDAIQVSLLDLEYDEPLECELGEYGLEVLGFLEDDDGEVEDLSLNMVHDDVMQSYKV